MLNRVEAYHKFLGDEFVTLYVNSVSGNDSNSGLTPALAKLTLDNARSTAVSSYGAKAKIFVNAPNSTPVQGFVDFSSGIWEIDGYNGQTWYIERATTWSSGWSDLGSGIYSRVQAGDADLMFVTTQTDSDGFQRFLTKNTSTPTTPSAGQFGVSGGSFYVHLFDDANANSHTIKRHNTGYLIRTTGTTKLTISNAYGQYNGSNGVFEASGVNSTLICKNCTAIYSNNTGFGVPVSGGRLIAYNCLSQRHVNDGFNINANRADLINCDGSYNLDEGASPHNDSILNVIDGRYHHNNRGGLTAVGTSNMNVNGAIIENNGLDAQAGIEANGFNYANTAIGSLINCIARNNNRSGFYCANSASVSFTNFLSGVAQGNNEADTLCA